MTLDLETGILTDRQFVEFINRCGLRVEECEALRLWFMVGTWTYS